MNDCKKTVQTVHWYDKAARHCVIQAALPQVDTRRILANINTHNALCVTSAHDLSSECGVTDSSWCKLVGKMMMTPLTVFQQGPFFCLKENKLTM
jgi:hypothetical protein